MNCLYQCNYWCELNTEPDVDYSKESYDTARHEDWFQLGTEKDVKASCYMPINNELVVCGV